MDVKMDMSVPEENSSLKMLGQPLKIREKSWRQKTAVTMSELDSKSNSNFSEVFPTNFSLEYMKSIYRYSYDIHFKADWT